MLFIKTVNTTFCIRDLLANFSTNVMIFVLENIKIFQKRNKGWALTQGQSDRQMLQAEFRTGKARAHCFRWASEGNRFHGVDLRDGQKAYAASRF